MTLFCLVAFPCWEQRQGLELAPEQHLGVPGHPSSPTEGGELCPCEADRWGAMGGAHQRQQTGQHIPHHRSQGHISTQGQARGHSTVGCQGGSHFSPGSLLTLFLPRAHMSRDLDITTSSFTTNVYKRLIYTLQRCKYLYNLQNNLKTLIPLVRIKLRGQELDHGLKLNIPSERETIKKSTHSVI